MLTVQSILSQEDIYSAEKVIAELPRQGGESYEHYFADGIYGRVMKIPADSYATGKAHRTEHLTILLKGSLAITLDDGTVVVKEAPAVMVTPAGKKKMVYCAEETWVMNVHATESQDLEVIESQVIIPEQEHRMLLETQRSKEMRIEQSEVL